MIPGTNRFPADEDVLYTRIYAGVSWPAVRPGWVVVVGEHRHRHVAGVPVMVVLDEGSDGRLWHIVERAAAMAWYYRPERVLADAEHAAAMQFVHQLGKTGLAVEPSLLCAMDGPLAYAMPMLKRLLDTRRLILPAASGLNGEMMTPPPHEDLATLHLKEYPAIAALAFAVLELERTRGQGAGPRQDRADTGGRVL